IPQNKFAIGGAKTDTTNTVAPGLPGFTQEWQGFVASGKRISASDLVEISIGGNDARQYYQTGGTLAGVQAASPPGPTTAPPARQPGAGRRQGAGRGRRPQHCLYDGRCQSVAGSDGKPGCSDWRGL